MAPQREWFEKDYYKALGLSDSATEKEIKAAYRKLSKQYHPDASSGNEERFKEVSAAYDVLGDPAKRKEYDEVRRLGPVGNIFGGGAGRGGGGAGFSQFNFDDLGDLFGGIFNRGGGGGGRATRTRPGPRRGDDLEAQLHLSFEDAVRGVTTTVNLTSDAPCSTCRGSGARPGTSPTTCPECNGRGVVQEDQGLFSFSQPCRRCAGLGALIEDPCPTCGGTGVERRPRQVKVRIPAGVDDGQRIRLKGKGGPGRDGGPSGDLYVVVRVEPHRLFARKGRDLLLTVPITFAEAALGAEITVPTLEGSPVTLRVPAGTSSGRTFRVRGRGVPGPRGVGDLLVTVEVAVPKKLSPAERQAVEALAAAANGSPRAHLLTDQTRT